MMALSTPSTIGVNSEGCVQYTVLHTLSIDNTDRSYRGAAEVNIPADCVFPVSSPERDSALPAAGARSPVPRFSACINTTDYTSIITSSS